MAPLNDSHAETKIWQHRLWKFYRGVTWNIYATKEKDRMQNKQKKNAKRYFAMHYNYYQNITLNT